MGGSAAPEIRWPADRTGAIVHSAIWRYSNQGKKAAVRLLVSDVLFERSGKTLRRASIEEAVAYQFNRNSLTNMTVA
jgi:hypothetical protein